MAKKHKVDVVNPAKKAAKKGDKKGKGAAVAKKRRKKSRRNPGTSATPNPRRRRRKGGRRRARRNPSGIFGSLSINLSSDLQGAFGRVLGKMSGAWMVQRFGDPPEANPGGPSSTQGDRWSIKNAFLCWLGGVIAGEIVSRGMGNREWGQMMYDGAFDLATTKVIWSDVIGRLPGGRVYFGQIGEGAAPTHDQALALAARDANEGDLLYDGQGNTYLLRNGRWESMQGLTEASPLGSLTEASPLGHILPAGEASAAASEWGERNWRGSSDPYAAAFSGDF